jgi:hypothetical protein
LETQLIEELELALRKAPQRIKTAPQLLRNMSLFFKALTTDSESSSNTTFVGW